MVGVGSHFGGEEMEECLLDWILERRGKQRLHVSRKLIMKKAKSTYDEMKKHDQAPPEEFLATVGWLNRFMKRHGLSLLEEQQTLCRRTQKILSEN